MIRYSDLTESERALALRLAVAQKVRAAADRELDEEIAWGEAKNDAAAAFALCYEGPSLFPDIPRLVGMSVKELAVQLTVTDGLVRRSEEPPESPLEMVAVWELLLRAVAREYARRLKERRSI